jgi:hypothetical protein
MFQLKCMRPPYNVSPDRFICEISHAPVDSNDSLAFEFNQYVQFSRTVVDNAVNQRKIIRHAYKTFCN